MAFSVDIYENCNEAFYCMAVWANSVTSGVFWTVLLLGFVIILIAGTQKFGNARSFGFGGVIGMFGSMYLVTLQLMTWSIASMFIIAGGIGLVAMVLNER